MNALKVLCVQLTRDLFAIAKFLFSLFCLHLWRIKMLFNRLPKHNSFFACVKTVFRTTLCPRKKGATDFFAVTFTNIDGFSEFFVHNFTREC